jgi:hypothetical protein
MSTLTTANSSFAIIIPGVYNAPTNIKGYATDDAFAIEEIEKVEARIGVDGKASFGYKFELYQQDVTLQGDSASFDVFNNWQIAMDAVREVLTASATIIIPSIGYKYTFTNGTMTRFKPFPDAKKVLQTTKFRITWESVVGSKVA